MRRARAGGVRITVPARLHLGFLDLEGGLGRRFGSLGITLDGPTTRLSLAPTTRLSAEGPDAERARRYLALLTDHFGLDDGLGLAIETAIPAHAGLGSGTQLALAVGTAVCRLFDLDVAPAALAQMLDRGARSGIGLGAFLDGGVLLDGGRGAAELPPPILSRLPFPEDWRILMIYDRSGSGVHGMEEVEAFQRLPAFPADSAAHLCRLTLMAALPALAEGDIAGFGAAVAELQCTIGDHFAPAQGGRFASPAVAEVLAWLERQGIDGIGQSSWGPTGFGLVAGEAAAQGLLAGAQGLWPPASGLEFEVRRGRNFGAEVEVKKAVRAAP
jgi:beta-RFAP synthase